jgi:hypothetical protein
MTAVGAFRKWPATLVLDAPFTLNVAILRTVELNYDESH